MMMIRSKEEIIKQIAFIIESYEVYKEYKPEITPIDYINKYYYDIKDWILKRN